MCWVSVWRWWAWVRSVKRCDRMTGRQRLSVRVCPLSGGWTSCQRSEQRHGRCFAAPKQRACVDLDHKSLHLLEAHEGD